MKLKLFVRMIFVFVIINNNEVNGNNIGKIKSNYVTNNREDDLSKRSENIENINRSISKLNLNFRLVVLLFIVIVVFLITVIGLIGIIFIIKEYQNKKTNLPNNSNLAYQIYQMKLNKLIAYIENYPPPPPPYLSKHITI